MAFRRLFRRYGVFILGLGMMAGSARATITYQTSLATFGTQASVTDGLTVSSPITFAGALTETAGVANDEYIDPTTGVEFIAFNGSGTTNEAFASVTGGVLNTVAASGDTIEVLLPTSVDYGFGFNFTTAYYEGVSLCVGTGPATFGNCLSGGTYIAQNGSGFVGAINDYLAPPAPLTAVWLNPQSGFSSPAGTDLQSFEVATEAADTTPEGSTNLLIGSGLIGLYWLRRRRRHQPVPA